MSQIVRCALIQTAQTADAEKLSPESIKEEMITRHLQHIEAAAAQGAQVLCMQELFYGPYFCPSQDIRWYALTEAVPDGPTIHLMQEYAKKYQMVLVVPVYEREMAGVYYNTAAVIDADGRYLGKYRKTHIPQVQGFLGKVFLSPGKSWLPGISNRLWKNWCLHLLRQAFPGRRQSFGVKWGGNCLQSLCYCCRAFRISLDARTTRSRRCQRLFCGGY
jgi:Predicted amidohydrolase